MGVDVQFGDRGAAVGPLNNEGGVYRSPPPPSMLEDALGDQALKQQAVDQEASNISNINVSSAALGIGYGAQAVSAGIGLASSIIQSGTLKRQAQMQREAAQHNMKMAEINKRQMLAQSKEQEIEYVRQAGLVRGSQKAGLAAQGIKVSGSGAAGTVVSKLDQEHYRRIADNLNAMRVDAWRKAMGMDAESMQGMSNAYAGAAAMDTRANAGVLAASDRMSSTLLGSETFQREIWGRARMGLESGGRTVS